MLCVLQSRGQAAGKINSGFRYSGKTRRSIWGTLVYSMSLLASYLAVIAAAAAAAVVLPANCGK